MSMPKWEVKMARPGGGGAVFSVRLQGPISSSSAASPCFAERMQISSGFCDTAQLSDAR